MKVKLNSIAAGRIFFPAAFLALAGCSSVASRQSTTESSPVAVFAESSASKSRLPEPTFTVLPEFPLELRSAGITGTVKVRCAIDERGNVQEMKVASASNDAFIKPALQALKLWQFKPALRDGVPVAMEIIVPIRFALAQ